MFRMRKLVWILLFSLIVLTACLVKTPEKPVVITTEETPVQNTTVGNITSNNTVVNQTTNQTINSTNNQTTNQTNTTEDLCDLYVKNMTSNKLYPEAGEDVTISFIIENIGKTKCPEFNYSITVTKNSQIVKTDSFYVAELNKSKSISEEYEYEFPTDGNYTIEIFADSLSKIKEESEKNNKASKKYLITKGTQGSSGNQSYTDYNCTDSDKGDKKVAGICTDDLGSVMQDICISSSILWEAKCIQGKCDYDKNITCRCVEGACQ